nr:centromere-associated protein E-like isoform X4 [Equus asinus]
MRESCEASQFGARREPALDSLCSFPVEESQGGLIRFGRCTTMDQQNIKEVLKYEKMLLCDGKQHLTESLREKCFRIKELLKRYTEMDSHYECLNGLCLDLEREIETQRELSIRVKANLSLPHPQTRQIQKLLTANQRCSMEFHRVMKKLKVPPVLVISL